MAEGGIGVLLELCMGYESLFAPRIVTTEQLFARVSQEVVLQS